MSCFTVGTYSEGNLLVVYEIKRQVFPTAPSPTTTHFIVCMLKLKNVLLIGSNFKTSENSQTCQFNRSFGGKSLFFGVSHFSDYKP